MYTDTSTITGQLQPLQTVRYRKTLTKQDRLVLRAYLALILITSAAFIWYTLGSIGPATTSIAVTVSVGLILLLELIRVLQSLTLYIFARAAADPIPMIPLRPQRVAVLTTIVPSKEPFSLVARTLRAMKELEAPAGSTVDVWLLDEGNSPAIRARCELLGVHYFSRKGTGLEGWNADAGAYKARTKHGNHNAWRRANEHRYDIVAQMDPDHLPKPDFLTRTLGYFNDEQVGFVVAPQVYGNHRESWIARASAFQAYIFHGVMQRGGNGLGAPLLIGTNHLYRTTAFKEIGGYQDSIIEDHLTSMALFSTRRWKGVYTPDIIAVGEGPVSFTDYFNQQKRWAYGIWEIMFKASWRILPRMRTRQAAAFAMLQFFYPSVAVSWLASTFLTMFLIASPLNFQGVATIITLLWTYSIATALGMFYWLRKFNLVEHERRSWGIEGMALLLMCIPVYVSAGLQAIRGERLRYAVTAKGDLTSPDSLHTFRPHLFWLELNLAGLIVLFALGRDMVEASAFWIIVHMIVCAAPIVFFWYSSVLRAAKRFKRSMVHAFQALARRPFETRQTVRIVNE